MYWGIYFVLPFVYPVIMHLFHCASAASYSALTRNSMVLLPRRAHILSSFTFMGVKATKVTISF